MICDFGVFVEVVLVGFDIRMICIGCLILARVLEKRGRMQDAECMRAAGGSYSEHNCMMQMC